jgi:hypothetical protein
MVRYETLPRPVCMDVLGFAGNTVPVNPQEDLGGCAVQDLDTRVTRKARDEQGRGQTEERDIVHIEPRGG